MGETTNFLAKNWRWWIMISIYPDESSEKVLRLEESGLKRLGITNLNLQSHLSLINDSPLNHSFLVKNCSFYQSFLLQITLIPFFLPCFFFGRYEGVKLGCFRRGGDLDSSLQELLTESMEELERQMASKEAETGGTWFGCFWTMDGCFFLCFFDVGLSFFWGKLKHYLKDFKKKKSSKKKVDFCWKTA